MTTGVGTTQPNLESTCHIVTQTLREFGFSAGCSRPSLIKKGPCYILADIFTCYVQNRRVFRSQVRLITGAWVGVTVQHATSMGTPVWCVWAWSVGGKDSNPTTPTWRSLKNLCCCGKSPFDIKTRSGLSCQARLVCQELFSGVLFATFLDKET